MLRRTKAKPEFCREEVSKPVRGYRESRGRWFTARAIFCRTGSAIQSALARWNLTSALEFTVEKGRERGSLRRSGTLSIRVAGAHQTLNHREVRRPPGMLLSCVNSGRPTWPWNEPARTVRRFWTKINFWDFPGGLGLRL